MSDDRPRGDEARAQCPETLAVRRERLKELKRQIQRGEYETEDKMVTALRRMLADLRGVSSGRRPSREDESGDESP